MKTIKILIATSLLLIFSCGNLGEQSQKSLKLDRSGNAFSTVLQQVREGDKAFAELIDKADSWNNHGIDQISFIGKRGRYQSSENFISKFYENVTKQIAMISDSTDSKFLLEQKDANEAEFWSKMKENIEIERQILALEEEVQQRIQKMKVTKTLDYMKEYQDSKTFENHELRKELEEMKIILNIVIEQEQRSI